jgi:hypothetical protein
MIILLYNNIRDSHDYDQKVYTVIVNYHSTNINKIYNKGNTKRGISPRLKI